MNVMLVPHPVGKVVGVDRVSVTTAEYELAVRMPLFPLCLQCFLDHRQHRDTEVMLGSRAKTSECEGQAEPSASCGVTARSAFLWWICEV